MTDPFLDSLATALAAQAATALGTAGTKAVEKIRELIHRRATQDPETQNALEAAEQAEAPEAAIRALAERLDHVGRQDEEFGRQLHAEGAEVHREISASDSSVVNTVHGNAEKVIQTREIHGDITFN